MTIKIIKLLVPCELLLSVFDTAAVLKFSSGKCFHVNMAWGPRFTDYTGGTLVFSSQDSHYLLTSQTRTPAGYKESVVSLVLLMEKPKLYFKMF